MIIGLFIRNFKTYQGIHFIPISNKHKCCGLLGVNGIGKSSILEAIDCFFNDKKWNINNSSKKSGKSSKPYIVLILSLPKIMITQHQDEFDKIDKLFRNIMLDKINFGGSDKSVKTTLNEHYKEIKEINEDNYLFPIGIDNENNPTLGMLESLDEFKNIDFLKKILEHVKNVIDYVYIPKDMDSEAFTKLENKQIQVLMGESLEKFLNDKITIESSNTINTKLNEFINQLESEIPGYSYRTPTDRQQNLRKSYINNMIIESFFNIRRLHKKHAESFIEINSLSSGEKQKAIIDVAYRLLTNHRKDGSNLIIAIDEPESSLHISACFEQFSMLFDMSKECRQILFSSHWYGFLPILSDSNVCVISKSQSSSTHLFDLLDLTNYQEQINGKIRESKGKQPYHISLKSISDLTQSIIGSTISDTPYNWLICEGSSEKIYFEKYLEDEVKNKKLRIIPMGGANKIKSLYKNLVTPYEELKEILNDKEKNKKGKILLLSDTDQQLVNYEVINDKYLKCMRIVNEENKNTKMVLIQSNPTSPETEVEDCLNGKLFNNTLKYFRDSYPDLDKIIIKSECSEEIPPRALDLSISKKEILKKFFDDNKGHNKILFAKKYIELLNSSYSPPKLISDIKNFFK